MSGECDLCGQHTLDCNCGDQYIEMVPSCKKCGGKSIEKEHEASITGKNTENIIEFSNMNVRTALEILRNYTPNCIQWKYAMECLKAYENWYTTRYKIKDCRDERFDSPQSTPKGI